MSGVRAEMIERYVPLADSIARRYAYTSEPLDDLLQVARLGLVKAVDRFDPERGVAFSSYAVPTISGELRRHFRDRTWTVRPPRDLQELHQRVQRVRQTLFQELGREPTASDVADELGCATEDVVEAIAVGDAYAPRSLDVPVREDEDDGITEVDRLASTDRGIDRAETALALWQLGEVLDDRSWEVVRLRFEEDLLQREIAERVGCSQMHFSRLLTAALTELRDAAGACPSAFAA
jgi:RNA polymerase sigma-B factor